MLFTDIVASTAMWESHPEAMAVARVHHFDLLREAVSMQGGTLWKTVGDGGCAAFTSVPQALAASLAFQRALRSHHWPPSIKMRVRSAIHTGTVAWEDGDYVGRPVNRVARLVRLAAGGQLLVSAAAANLAETLPEGCDLLKFGSAVLKGFGQREEIFQLSHPDLVVTSPKDESDQPSNLESLAFTFVGRASELQDLRRKLLDRQERIVTITGMGGIGKSTLARQLAFECLPFFPDGVWFVECDGLTSLEEVRAAVVSVLGMPGASEAELATFFAKSRILLVLDCFEKLLSVAPTLGEWARKAPQIRLLVTSRTLLGLPNEFEYSLGPMAKGERVSGDALALFADAASHVVDGFEVTNSNRKLVREICETLEGVPLALVLASARLRTMTLSELRDTLQSRRLALLKRRVVGSDRHADLQVVIAESFGLLDAGDAVLLKRLGIFAGGFFREDAKAVLPDADLLDALDRLRENSLISTQSVGQRTRFKLLDTVREFIQGVSLVSPELDDSDRYVAHYLTHADRIDTLFQSGEWTAATSLLWMELPNLRQGWRENANLGAQLSYARLLARPLFELGVWDAFEELYGIARPAAEAQEDSTTLLALLGLHGALYRRRGLESEASIAWLQRLGLARKAGNERSEVDALNDLAQQSLDLGRLADARQYAVLAARQGRRCKQWGLLLTAETLLAKWAFASNCPEERIRARLRAIEGRLANIEDRDHLAFALKHLGHMYRMLGESTRGWTCLMRALEVAAEGQRVYGAGGILLECLDFEHSPEVRSAVVSILRKLPLDRASNVRRMIAKSLEGEPPTVPLEEKWEKLAKNLTKVQVIV